MIATNAKPAIIEPELKGRPMEFTKNISDTLNIFKIFGASNLKTNNKTATETTFAIIKF